MTGPSSLSPQTSVIGESILSQPFPEHSLAIRTTSNQDSQTPTLSLESFVYSQPHEDTGDIPSTQFSPEENAAIDKFIKEFQEIKGNNPDVLRSILHIYMTRITDQNAALRTKDKQIEELECDVKGLIEQNKILNESLQAQYLG